MRKINIERSDLVGEELTATVATLVAENKTIFKAMDKIDKRIEGVENLALSVQKLANSMETMTLSMAKMEKRLTS